MLVKFMARPAHWSILAANIFLLTLFEVFKPSHYSAYKAVTKFYDKYK